MHVPGSGIHIPVIDMNVKQLVKFTVCVAVGVWLVSRVTPGLAARVGIRPRPLLPQYQNTFYEPFGLVPVLPTSMSKPAPAATATAVPTAGMTQEQLGAAIVASTSNALSAITGGSGEPSVVIA